MAAYELLRAVADGAYANVELPHILKRRRLSPRDSAFTTELAFGTIRMQGFYDAVIEHAAQRPAEKIDECVLDVMRLGVHQLLGMRVPTHAAADQTVGLARTVCGAGAAGFVNAVMHRVSERSRDEWVHQLAPDNGGTSALAIRYSHPEWIVKALRGALIGHGRCTPDTVDGELVALLEADNDPPQVSLVARPGLATVKELVDEADARPSALSEFGAILLSGNPGSITAIRERRAAVQDEGSQLVAQALAEVELTEHDSAREKRAEQWLDLCAGPGGKAGLLAALARQQGARLTAVEVTRHRAQLVRQTLAPVLCDDGVPGELKPVVRELDGRDIGQDEPAAFDRVLVDVPCAGLGALRRRAEARWRRQPDDLAELGALQRDLLASAFDAAMPGGVIVYSTCSPHLAETTFVVSDALRRRDDVSQLDARPYFRDAAGHSLPELGDGPAVQLWPHVHGTDGMFFALFRKEI